MSEPSLPARFAAEETGRAQLPVVRFTSHQLVLKGEVRAQSAFRQTTMLDNHREAQEQGQT